MAAVFICIELWENPETALIVRPPRRPVCFHPLPREDESHPLPLSSGNLLAAILAMTFQWVDGGSVFCKAEGSSTVMSSRDLVSKHSLSFGKCFLCLEVRHKWE